MAVALWKHMGEVNASVFGGVVAGLSVHTVMTSSAGSRINAEEKLQERPPVEAEVK